jgi:hypothetical protein
MREDYRDSAMTGIVHTTRRVDPELPAVKAGGGPLCDHAFIQSGGQAARVRMHGQIDSDGE